LITVVSGTIANYYVDSFGAISSGCIPILGEGQSYLGVRGLAGWMLADWWKR